MYIQPHQPQPKKRFPLLGIALLVALIGLIGFIIFSGLHNLSKADQADTAYADTNTIDSMATLNAIDTTKLSPLQSSILKIIKQEYAKSPKSYDATVLKYTEGFKESWCSDFISWVMNQAGSPNISSDTGYWRIPGVLSMQTYYKGIGGYSTVDDSYKPQLGDVAFYIGEDTPDGSSGQHVAFVLSYDGKTLTTIGGNEGDDGVMRIRSESVTTNVKKGLVGYGILE